MKTIIVLVIIFMSTICNAETLKAYLSIDQLTEQEIPVMQDIASQYFVEYALINIRNDRRFYIGIIKNDSMINDFISALSIKSPSIIGVFDISGNQVVAYQLKESEFLSLMPDDKTYDVDGNELTSTRPTKVKPLKNFGGWGECSF